MRPWMLPTLAAVLAVGLVVASAVAVVNDQRATEADARADALAEEVADLRDRISELEVELEAARAPDPTPQPDASPDDAEEDDGDLGGLGGLIEGLFGDTIPGQQCFTPDTAGGLDGLLDGLFGGGSLPNDPDTLVDVISDHVADLRELDWQEPVDVEFLDTPALQERLEALIDADLDPAEVEAGERLLATLGAIPDDASLEQLQRDLLDDQVAGYYVPETGELVVRVPADGELRPADKVTLAHELDHALTDQVLGIPDRSEEPFVDDADAALGVIAVVEGDATLLMNLWALAHLPLTDQLAMAMDPSIADAQRALDGVPHYLQQELLYPYMAGLDWACRTYLDGGWDAIDAAYDDPPSTSAEVLWGEPVTPADTADLTAPDGYGELTSTTMGAAHLLWLLEAPGGDTDRGLDDPDGRARAWAGGQVAVWGRSDDTAVGIALIDGGEGSAPLCDTIDDWYAASFPDATRSASGPFTRFDGDAAATIRCAGDDVVLGIAPDSAAADHIAGG